MWFCNLVSHMRTLFALPSAHISTRPAEMWLQLTSFAFSCFPCGTYLARGNIMWKHMNQKHIAIHCYVISTRVIFVEFVKDSTCEFAEKRPRLVIWKMSKMWYYKKPAINKYAFLWAASTYHSCGDWSDQNQSRCENSQVKSQNNNPSGTVGLTDNFRLWNSSSLFTFAISFDWYSSESLLQWWSYELLNLLSRQMLLFFRESFLKLLKKVTFKSLFLYWN